MNFEKLFLKFLFLLFTYQAVSQDISLLNQFNGRYDFTFIGNTLNTDENGTGAPCTITTTSSAVLNLNPTDVVEAAFLYWAGSGTGDLDIQLNNVDITASRNFAVIQPTSQRPFFSAFADITTQIQATGNGIYTFSELDLTSVITPYCTNGTNFGGWAIIIVYKNSLLPLNQLNIYDGLQFVPNSIDITLNSLNVIDNADAKIGFLAWEGDQFIANNESLRINGNVLSNALNPANNAFNGTNSETGATDLFNMDLDIYNIQNNINIGDVSATIQLTSSQDFVMINAIVTKLNSQLPDATVIVTNYDLECNSRTIPVNYSVRNFNCTNSLPTGTYLTFYADGIAIATAQTTENIPIDEFRNYQIILTIPNTIPLNFDLKIIVDNNNSIASVTETNENNNEFNQNISLLISPEFNILSDIVICNEGNGKGTFNFSNYESEAIVNSSDTISFYENLTDATSEINPITNTSAYIATVTPKTIYIRLENLSCHTITEFNLLTETCEIVIYNHYTPNNDGVNDAFFIKNLRDFDNFEILIYNRWGHLVWKGDKNIPDWDGKCNQNGVLLKSELPEGVYYYVVTVNDGKYPKPLVGWVFLNR